MQLGVQQPVVDHEIGGDAASKPQGCGMVRAGGFGPWELVGEFSKEPLEGALEAADAAHV